MSPKPEGPHTRGCRSGWQSTCLATRLCFPGQSADPTADAQESAQEFGGLELSRLDMAPVATIAVVGQLATILLGTGHPS